MRQSVRRVTPSLRRPLGRRKFSACAPSAPHPPARREFFPPIKGENQRTQQTRGFARVGNQTEPSKSNVRAGPLQGLVPRGACRAVVNGPPPGGSRRDRMAIGAALCVHRLGSGPDALKPAEEPARRARRARNGTPCCSDPPEPNSRGATFPGAAGAGRGRKPGGSRRARRAAGGRERQSAPGQRGGVASQPARRQDGEGRRGRPPADWRPGPEWSGPQPTAGGRVGGPDHDGRALRDCRRAAPRPEVPPNAARPKPY